MEKNKIISIILLLLAIICFCLVGYSYWEYRNLVKEFGYYGVSESELYQNEKFRITTYQFYWVMIKFTFAGVVSLAVSVYVLIKNKK